ncbi:MAG: hypothetical protein RMM10_13525 [Anaerolineae bacterium]|uniref:hypothetical protein n=1 Tax=Thermoflexus sp. TaxID=1969742 RepID=UPI0025D26FA7|nr:hypothetical protein [Thermoflexus sp.]MCS7352495.1 hypothetical protein [Thermoflexus sp.]MDW8181964.1 hypothetical protein [Anaerolineae bacterium]
MPARRRRRNSCPQSNQRGIETPVRQHEINQDQPLNRTSVGLKRSGSLSIPLTPSRPQSNQRGIETVSARKQNDEIIMPSIEPAWD